MVLALCLNAGVALAGKLPNYYPETFAYSGVLQGLDVERGTAIINGTVFQLSKNLQVHTPDTQFGTTHSLRSGMPVGCRYTGSTPKDGLITEIWVLPKDYSFPSL